MKTAIKVTIAVAVLAAIALIAVAVIGNDDYDYKSQSQEQISKLGYEVSDLEVTDVTHGTNLFGASVIKVTGKFTTQDGVHEFSLVTSSGHDPTMLTVDGQNYMTDNLGKTAYNYSTSDLGPFKDRLGYPVEPPQGMKFILMKVVIKNNGITDGERVSAPYIVGASGDYYDYDWSDTYDYSDTYNRYTGTKIGVGSSAEYMLVYEVPLDETVRTVGWSGLDMDLYGYILDRSLPITI